MNDSHRCLLRYQTTEELLRKANKARSKSNLWTQEEIDLGIRCGAETGLALGMDYDDYNLYIDDYLRQ